MGGTVVAPVKFGVAPNLLAGLRLLVGGRMWSRCAARGVSGATPETTGRRPVPPGLPLARATIVAALIAAAVTAAAQPTNPPTGLDFNSFKIVVERNIFNQDRMPHERAVQSTRVPDSFSLVGTLFYAGGDIAFFDGTSSEFRKALKVDGDIAGFKVTAITLNSVTLSDGTNQTVLKIATPMRRDDDGHWSVSAGSGSSAGYASDFGSGGSFSTRSRRYNANARNFTAATETPAINGGDNNSFSNGTEESPPSEIEDNPPETAAPPGGANDALSRLMQRRAQEEQQLRQGQ